MKIPEFLAEMLADIAKKEGFIDHELELGTGSRHGDNYIGVIVSVKVIGDRVRNGVVVSDALHLICKLAPESKERRDAFQVNLTFEREVEMYTNVLPVFVELQKERGLSADESFLSFPKVYAMIADRVNEKYAVIMEDLRSKDFVMWSRYDPVPLSHEELLFKQLGRFHAISFALKDQRPEVFQEFKKLDDAFIGVLEKGMVQGVVETAIDRALAAVKDEQHRELLHDVRKNYLQILKNNVTTEMNERFGVINHGDCWINNFLFQYDENSKELRDICFLDWQIGRYASPALDILYQFFSSTRKELRDQSYNDLLRIYHNELSVTVRKLGSDPEKLFRYSDLLDELKAHGGFALVMGVLLTAIVLTKPDDVRDMDEYTQRLAKGEDVTAFTNDGVESDIYVKVVNDVIGDVIAYGYNH